MGKILSTKYYDTGEFHLVIAFVNATTPGKITLASYRDTVEPEVKISSIQPAKPRMGKAVTVFVRASDGEWGIDRVVVRVTTPSMEEFSVKAIQLPLSNQYIAVFTAAEPGEYSIVAEAIDQAGNIGSSEQVKVSVAGERKAETTTPPATTTPETMPEETTGTPEPVEETTPGETVTRQPQETVAREPETVTTPEREPTEARTATDEPETTTEAPEATETVERGETPVWAVASILLITVIVLGLAFMARLKRAS